VTAPVRRVAATRHGRPDAVARWRTLEGRARLPSHSHSPSISFSRALEPPRKATAVTLLRRAREPSPLPRFSLWLARDSIIII